DDEDPFPPGDASPAGVPEDHVEEGGQGQKDDPEDGPDDRPERAVDPGCEDPGQREREPRREERDQYDEASQEVSSLPASGNRLLNLGCGRSRTFSRSVWRGAGGLA